MNRGECETREGKARVWGEICFYFLMEESGEETPESGEETPEAEKFLGVRERGEDEGCPVGRQRWGEIAVSEGSWLGVRGLEEAVVCPVGRQRWGETAVSGGRWLGMGGEVSSDG